MQYLVRLWLLACVLALTGCGGGGGGITVSLPEDGTNSTPDTSPGTGGTGPGTGPGASPGDVPATTGGSGFSPPPNPTFAGVPVASTLTVAPNLDSAARASANVGVEGGTVTATDSRGNVYRLAIPAGALTQTTTISITPVSDMPTLPFSQFVAAAHFEPEGLQLMTPAELRVQTVAAIDATHLVGFGYLPGGADLVLQPMHVDGTNAFTMMVQHFSGEGAAVATTAQVQQQVGRQSASFERTYQNMAEALATQAPAAGSSGSALFEQLAQLHQAYYDKVVVPLLDSAEANPDDFALEASQKALGLARAVSLVDPNSPLPAEILQRVVRLLEKTWMVFARQCYEQHAVVRGPDLLALLRQLQLLGIDPPGGLDMFLNCYRLEFTMHSTTAAVGDNGPELTYDYTIDRMLLEPLTGVPSKRIALDASMPPRACPRTAERKNLGLARALYFAVTRAPSQDDVPRLRAALGDIDLAYVLPQPAGEPEEITWTFTCPGAPSSDFTLPQFSVGFYFPLHIDELLPFPHALPAGLTWPTAEFGVLAQKWQIGAPGSAEVARKEYTRSTGRLTEQTTLTLTHVPLAPPVPLQ